MCYLHPISISIISNNTNPTINFIAVRCVRGASPTKLDSELIDGGGGRVYHIDVLDDVDVGVVSTVWSDMFEDDTNVERCDAAEWQLHVEVVAMLGFVLVVPPVLKCDVVWLSSAAGVLILLKLTNIGVLTSGDPVDIPDIKLKEGTSLLVWVQGVLCENTIM